MKAHKYAEIFPMLDDHGLAELAKDISENGLAEPILTYGGQILDGRNRYKACQVAKVQPRFVEADCDTDEEALTLVMSLNLHRRHLNESQRAIVGARVLPFYEALAAERRAATVANLRQNQPAPPKPSEAAQRPAPVTANLPSPAEVVPRARHMARDDAAAAVNVSSRSVENAKKVIECAAPEVVAAVESGKLAVSAAAQVVSMPAEEQKEVARLVVSGEASSGAEAVRKVKMPHVQYNSGENEWYTPAVYIEAARSVMECIDLDPASCDMANATVQASEFFSKDDDGLTKEWRGRVWMNPPYEKGLIDRFAAKFADSVRAGDVSEACVLVNNATETNWFDVMASVASGLCFPKGRVRFLSPSGEKGAPLQGQAVIYVGPNVQRFAEVFADFGIVAEVDNAGL